MRWVTYLSPSGGSERPGVIDDGCVFGYPGDETVPHLLAASVDALAGAYQRALSNPVEIIVEFETRLVAPLHPAQAVRVDLGGRVLTIDPAQILGTDDGVAAPNGGGTLTAAIGVAAVFGATQHVGYTPACLWSDSAGAPTGLTLGPAIVTHDEFDGTPLSVTASVDGEVIAGVRLDGKLGWTDALRTGAGPDSPAEVVAAMPESTRALEPGEELLIEGGVLGEFEVRVGSGS
ncbi:hypothetical protein CLV63_11130 [Murinocardiopsis flavida]|uniref:Uncharacterized protein n=1 Tax=Murinocardiopsis flavida TaxID=645275 RepID=A0A2P8DGW6_9ACTN|nr:hypothetical protein [Murinocardiopsis flavida]PSK96436.1 hypothetical protein CLV63_11130 [Murinocardiopsis flavida]